MQLKTKILYTCIILYACCYKSFIAYYGDPFVTFAIVHCQPKRVCGFIEHVQVFSGCMWSQSTSGPALHTVSESGTVFARLAGSSILPMNNHQ